jgi:hypothetical protein
MRIKSFVVTAAVLASGFVSVTNGCGGDDEEERRTSQKGQACQVTNDCAAGLACLPLGNNGGGICVVGEFRVSVTAKECAVIDCETPADCCSTPPATCNTLQQQCANADGGATSPECQTYNAICLCDIQKNDCQNNKCVRRCKENIECSGRDSKCAGGVCVQCASDPDCGGDQQCINGSCQAPCKTDGDCAGFNRCLAGRCIESGCQTDRECIAATKNVEATCGTDQKCIVPCSTDLECGNPTAYKFFSCIDRQCVYTGCGSDKDCRLFLTGASDASTLGPKQHVTCRDKQRPGVTTAP